MKPTAAWTVKGHRLEYFESGAQRAQLRLDGERTGWPVQLEQRQYALRFRPGRMGPVIDLVRDDDQVIPRTPEHVVPLRPSPGTLCAHHDTDAQIACGRCGTFACDGCQYLDGVHCRMCADILLAQQFSPPQGGGLYYLPVFLYLFPFAGFVGLLVGMLIVGPVVVVIVNRQDTQRGKLRWASGLHLSAWALLNGLAWAL